MILIHYTISSTVTQKSSNVSGAVGRALVTPFTAAVDIVTLPIVLPFAAFALKDGMGSTPSTDKKGGMPLGNPPLFQVAFRHAVLAT